MKTTAFYQVFDNVGGMAITGLIPAQNRLTAALGFRNAYMVEKDFNKNPYAKTYKALELIEVTFADINEDGTYFVHESPADMANNWTLKGSDVISFIQQEMANRGVDDFILDDDKED